MEMVKTHHQNLSLENEQKRICTSIWNEGWAPRFSICNSLKKVFEVKMSKYKCALLCSHLQPPKGETKWFKINDKIDAIKKLSRKDDTDNKKVLSLDFKKKVDEAHSCRKLHTGLRAAAGAVLHYLWSWLFPQKLVTGTWKSCKRTVKISDKQERNQRSC